MNGKVLICFSFIIILIVIIVFIFLRFSKSNSKQLELTYEINAGIPFRWEVEVDNENVVRFIRSYVVRDDNKGAIVGASVYTNYVFEGVSEGETIIRFKYVNFADNYVSNEKIHKVYVDKDLNISLLDG